MEANHIWQLLDCKILCSGSRETRIKAEIHCIGVATAARRHSKFPAGARVVFLHPTQYSFPLIHQKKQIQ